MEQGITCKVGAAGEVWNNLATTRFIFSTKTESSARNVFRNRDRARAYLASLPPLANAVGRNISLDPPTQFRLASFWRATAMNVSKRRARVPKLTDKIPDLLSMSR